MSGAGATRRVVEWLEHPAGAVFDTVAAAGASILLTTEMPLPEGTPFAALPPGGGDSDDTPAEVTRPSGRPAIAPRMASASPHRAVPEAAVGTTVSAAPVFALRPGPRTTQRDRGTAEPLAAIRAESSEATNSRLSRNRPDPPAPSLQETATATRAAFGGSPKPANRAPQTEEHRFGAPRLAESIWTVFREVERLADALMSESPETPTNNRVPLPSPSASTVLRALPAMRASAGASPATPASITEGRKPDILPAAATLTATPAPAGPSTGAALSVGAAATATTVESLARALREVDRLAGSILAAGEEPGAALPSGVDRDALPSQTTYEAPQRRRFEDRPAAPHGNRVTTVLAGPMAPAGSSIAAASLTHAPSVPAAALEADPEWLASLVNDVLAEQARRHGVDLS
jgi:hypothetical protein